MERQLLALPRSGPEHRQPTSSRRAGLVAVSERHAVRSSSPSLDRRLAGRSPAGSSCRGSPSSCTLRTVLVSYRRGPSVRSAPAHLGAAAPRGEPRGRARRRYSRSAQVRAAALAPRAPPTSRQARAVDGALPPSGATSPSGPLTVCQPGPSAIADAPSAGTPEHACAGADRRPPDRGETRRAQPPAARDRWSGVVWSVDLSRALAGPHAAMMLGDLGARVDRGRDAGALGDDTRGWGPPVRGARRTRAESTYFLSCNRNKESIALDLTSDERPRRR